MQCTCCYRKQQKSLVQAAAAKALEIAFSLLRISILDKWSDDDLTILLCFLQAPRFLKYLMCRRSCFQKSEWKYFCTRCELWGISQVVSPILTIFRSTKNRPKMEEQNQRWNAVIIRVWEERDHSWLSIYVIHFKGVTLIIYLFTRGDGADAGTGFHTPILLSHPNQNRHPTDIH